MAKDAGDVISDKAGDIADAVDKVDDPTA